MDVSFFINREETILVSRALKIYIRSLEKKLSENMKAGDDKGIDDVKRKIRKCTKIITKAAKYVEGTSNLFLLVGDEFVG